MGKQKKTRKYSVAKKIVSLKDSRLKANQEKEDKAAKKKEEEEAPRHVDQTPSALWFKVSSPDRQSTFAILICNSFSLYSHYLSLLIDSCCVRVPSRCRAAGGGRLNGSS